MPDYEVLYDDAEKNQLKDIKNSYWRHIKDREPQKTINVSKSHQASTKTIVSIRSSARLAAQIEEQHHKNNRQHNTIDFPEQSSKNNRQHNTIDFPEQHHKNNRQHNTIDFPEQSSKLKSKKRPLSLEKEEKLLIHRRTLYNRNMLGMMMAQAESTIKPAPPKSLKEQPE